MVRPIYDAPDKQTANKDSGNTGDGYIKFNLYFSLIFREQSDKT